MSFSMNTIDVKEEDDIILEEFDDSEYREQILEELQYPSIFLSGITTLDEVKFFKKRAYSEDRALPIYGEIDGEYFKIGMLDLTLDSLLSLRTIFDYSIEIKYSKDEGAVLDLNNPDVLIQFIRL